MARPILARTTAAPCSKSAPPGALTPLHAFLGSDGEEPYAGLVQGSDGFFYGTTYSGGTNNYGTVFKISATGTFTSLYSFAGLDGAYPQGVLVQGTDGYFYGTTYQGGTNYGVTIGDGTVFRMNFSAAPVQGLFTLGNPLSSRTFNSDGDPTNAQFVVDFPITSPGNLQSILTWGQNSGAGIPGVGETFYGYVLRPVGTNFQVMLETGPLTVANIGTNLFAAPPFALQVGDLIAHYGRGIPFSNGTGGPSSTYDNNGLPLPMPSVGQLLQLPGTTYPLYNDGGRNYAIAVVVSGVPNLAITPSGNNFILSWPANGASTLCRPPTWPAAFGPPMPRSLRPPVPMS
ncbi:MAG TPA: choice-of-anchor tandem repeat GloVer-containing protein [Verrucomicrobiae bacterium]|nr:choice-of-anchor tandem repeat GloVer-containing protein [Verrucomicrobiae bacterium]